MDAATYMFTDDSKRKIMNFYFYEFLFYEFFFPTDQANTFLDICYAHRTTGDTEDIKDSSCPQGIDIFSRDKTYICTKLNSKVHL